MSSTMETAAPQKSTSKDIDAGQALATLAMRWQTGAVLLLLAIIQQSLGHHNADNAWLMTVAERLFDGARIYSDIIETNPPASFLIYAPAVAAARLSHLPVEFMASVMVFAVALGSLFLGLAVARRSQLLMPDEIAIARNAGIFALICVPGICFAQREHAALLLMTPVLFVYAARAQDGPVSASHALLAGLMAGAGVCIKPYFALVMALPFFIAVWRRRTIALAWQAENIVALIVAGLYLGCVYYFFPGFFSILPSLLDTYIQVTNPLRLLVKDIFFLLSLVLLLTLTITLRSTRFNSVSIMLAAGAAGFTIAALIQAKGWLNHYQPGLSLAVLALAIAAAPAIAAIARKQTIPASWPRLRLAVMFVLLPSVLILPMIYGAPNQFAMQEEYPGLKTAVLRHAPQRPKIMAISVSLDVAFPLVRQVKGQWVGRTNILWLMGYARLLLDRGTGDSAKYQSYIDRDAQMFAADVRDNRPDIILSGSGPHIRKIWQHPAIIAAMANYKKVETVSGIAIYIPAIATAAVSR